MSFSEWKTYRLGDLIEVNKKSISKNFEFDTIEYFDTSSVTANKFSEPARLLLKEAPSRAKRIVEHNDVLYSTVRPNQLHYGIIKNPKPNTVVSTGFAVLKAKGINPEYLFYYLTQNEIVQYLNSIAETSTTTFPAFNPSNIEDLEAALPDLKTQQRIASILSSLDNAIELNQQINKTLEEMAKAIFKEWFIEFNYPKATGKFQETEIGKIPIGWKVEPLDEIAEFLNGLALQKYPAKEGEEFLPVIKIKELKNGNTNNADKANLNVPKKYIIGNGDLLFSWSATLEVRFWNGGKGALNQHLFKVTSNKYPLWFCYMWIQQHIDSFRRTARDKTTTMGHIQRHHLTEAQCVVPDNIEHFDKILSPLFEQINDNEKENQSLINLRDTLLPKLMKGEININL